MGGLTTGRAIPGIALLVIWLTAAACGGGGGRVLSLDEYFRQLDAAQETYASASASVASSYPRALEDVGETREAFTFSSENTRTFQHTLEDMRAPIEVVDVHDETIAALDLLAGAQEAVAAELEDVETLDAMNAVLDAHRQDSDDAFSRLGAACNAGQRIAREHGIDVDLECPA